MAAEAYCVLSNGTLTFYYDNSKSSRSGTKYTIEASYYIDTPWETSNRENIKKVVFNSSFSNYKPESTDYWFAWLNNLETITNLKYLNTSKVISMDSMFYGCESLKSLDVSTFDTSNVTNMNSMFDGCLLLTSLNVSNINTSNVTDMDGMFENCSSLKSLNLRDFDTSNVEYMQHMFNGCSSLTSLSIGNFNTSNVSNMYRMFRDCSKLTSLDLRQFDMTKVYDTEQMFYNCSQLKTIYSNSNWSNLSIKQSDRMFYGCTSLIGGKGTKYALNYIDIVYAHPDGGNSCPGFFTADGTLPADFDYSCATMPYCVLSDGKLTFYYDNKPLMRTGTKYSVSARKRYDHEPTTWYSDRASIETVTFDESFGEYRPHYTSYWFYGCSNITEIINTEYLSTENVSDMEGMFYDCAKLKHVYVGSFNTKNVMKMDYMFRNCSSLATLDLGDFDTSKVYGMSGMFYGCSSLTSLSISSFDTSGIHVMTDMFNGCSSLESLDVSGFSTSGVSNMSRMFSGCSKLTSLNLKNFDVAKVTKTEGMFQGCKSLKTIYANVSWNTATNAKSSDMFTGCTSLVGGKGTKFSSNHIDKAYAHPDDGSSNPGYFTMRDGSNFDDYDGDTIAYGVLNGGTITFYYDDKVRSHSGTKYKVEEKKYYVSSNTKGMPDWYEDRIKISRAVFDSTFVDYHPESTACWFYNCNKLASVEGMEYLNTDQAKSLAGMFRFCYVLKDIDLSNFDTHNVTDMSYLFCFCNSLANIDVSTFNTAKVTDMQHMFHTCPVEVLDLSMFDTHNLVYTSTMFSDCSKLKTIYGSRALWTNAKMKASTSNYMFYRCNVLVGGMGTRFDSKHINYEYAIIDDGPTVNPGYLTDPLPAEKEAYAVYKDNVLTFYYDNLIRTRTGTIYRYNAGEFRTKSDDGWAKHFNDALVKTVVFDPSFGDFHELTTTSYWFGHKDNSILTEFKGMQYLNTENVTDMSNMFISCRALTAVDVSHFDTGNVTTMLGMFCYCSKIKKLDLRNFDTAKCLDMSFMFGECSSMTSVDVSSFDTGRVTTMEKMFYYCSTLPTLDITMFDTHSCRNTIGMFKSCNSLTVLDLSSFDTHNVEKMDDATYGGMFEYCNKVRTIYVGDGWSTESLISHSDLLFKECNSLVGGAGTVYDPDHTDYTYAHVDGGPSNPGYLTYKSTSCDVNGDGVVDVADIASVISVMAGQGNENLKKAADVNGDGTVDVADIATVITRMAELARR